jgi:nucleotide-binding universal stress UspA family protein
MYKHILIPTDGSRLALRAVVHGVALAKATGARVTGLFVAPAATPVVYRRFVPVGYASPDEHAEMIERAAAHHLAAVSKAAARAGVRCDCVTVTGDFPAEAIAAEAKRRRCDLIFMASHSRAGLQALLLGSETRRVLQESKIPVLVDR